MSDKQYSEIKQTLDKIVGLLAIQGKEKNVQITILLSLGFTSIDIENITGIPSGTVRRLKSTTLKKERNHLNKTRK